MILGIAVQSSRLGNVLNEVHSFRQTQTAWTIREFMQGNWSVLSPLPIFGPPWNTPFEFPLFQGFAAFLGNVISSQPDFAARLAGLISFQVSALLLAILIKRWFAKTASIIALILYEFLPFSIQWGPSSLMEFTAVSLCLGSILLADSFRRSQRLLFLLFATLLLSLGYMVKITTALPWSLVFAAAVLAPGTSLKFSWRWKIPAASAPIILALLAGTAWTRIADTEKERNPITQQLVSSKLLDWNFGTWDQRLNPDSWIVIFDRFPSMGLGLSGLLVAIIIAGVSLQWNMRILAVLSVPLFSINVFLNLYVFHNYYLSAIYPAIIILTSIAISKVSEYIQNQRSRDGFLIAATLSVIILAWTSSEASDYAEVSRNATYYPPISKLINENVPVGEAVLVVGCDWDPTPLYYAERQGIMIPGWYTQGIPANWVGNEFNFIAFCTGASEPGEGDPASIIDANSWVWGEVAQGIFRIFPK